MFFHFTCIFSRNRLASELIDVIEFAGELLLVSSSPEGFNILPGGTVTDFLLELRKGALQIVHTISF